MRILTLIQSFLVLMLVLISGCTSVQELVDARPPAAIKADPALHVRRQVELALNEGRLASAQQLLLEIWQQEGQKLSLADLYTQVETLLLEEAIAAEDKGSFESAGELYRLVLELYPALPYAGEAVPESRDELSVKLARCADELMKRGLVAYRTGNLLSAVQAWKQIVHFIPDHAPALLAIETAERQIAALQKLAPVRAN